MNTFLTERQNLDEGETERTSEADPTSTTVPPPPPTKAAAKGGDGGDATVISYSAQTIYNFMENYGEGESAQFREQIDMPIMAMQTMRRMQEACTTKCYQAKQYRILREFLNLGTKA